MYTIYSFHRQTDVRKRSDLLMVTSFLHNGWLPGRPSAFFWRGARAGVLLKARSRPFILFSLMYAADRGFCAVIVMIRHLFGKILPRPDGKVKFA